MQTPLLHTLRDSATQLGIGRSTLYTLIAAGQIATVKIGRRTLIAETELQRFVGALSKAARAPLLERQPR